MVKSPRGPSEEDKAMTSSLRIFGVAIRRLARLVMYRALELC